MMSLFKRICDFFSNLFLTIVRGLHRFRMGIINVIKQMKSRQKNSGFPSGKAEFRLRDVNIYRRIRESSVRLYLKRTVSFHKKTSIITWQPLILVLAKVGIATIISLLFYSLYPYLAGYIKELIIFFRLHEIYNFDFPSTTFLETLAKIILLIIIGYTGIFYIKYQLEALLSALVISTGDKKIYYIKNAFFIKELYILTIAGIDHVVLKQNILSRIADIGTLVLQKKSGEKVVISSLKKASFVFTTLTGLTGPDTLPKEAGE